MNEKNLVRYFVPQILQEEEKERDRRIAESKDQDSEEYKARMQTYDQLVHVQEHLLRSAMQMKASHVTLFSRLLFAC